MSKHTREKYEDAVALLRARGKVEERERLGGKGLDPYRAATLSVACKPETLPLVITGLAELAVAAGAYLTCHAWQDDPSVELSISRPLDADEIVALSKEVA